MAIAMKSKHWMKIIGLVVLLGSVTLNTISPHQSVSAASPRVSLNGCTNSVKIMPLGDSITQGKYSGDDTDEFAVSDDIGYRKDLWNSLISAGYNVDFVGSQVNGQVYPSFDSDHEGHSGWTDLQIANNIYNAPGSLNFLGNHPADVILLHIGTNTPRDPAQVEIILNEINEYEADAGKTVFVILARIINKIVEDQGITQYNNQVVSMVQARADYGTELFLVNMESGAGLVYTLQPDGDFIDNIHPYATGYTKMAAMWKGVLDSLLQVCNNPPTITTNPGPQTNNEGDTVSIDIDATDPDLGQKLTYQAKDLPSGLTINSTTGVIFGTISQSAALDSPYSTQVVVYDDGVPSLSDTVQFSWIVNGVNDPPELDNPGNQINDEGDVINLPITYTDPEGGVTFTAKNLPAGLSIGSTTGVISGTIAYTAAGSYNVQITGKDPENAEDIIIFKWTVNNVNLPPVLTPIPEQNSDEGDLINLQVVATDDVDDDEETLIYSASGLPTGLTVSLTTGLISGTISCNAAAYSPYAVTVTVTDEGKPALKDSVSFIWNVIAQNCPPQITNPGRQDGYDGQEVTLQILASDPDGEYDLLFSASGLPPGLTIDELSGRISGQISIGAYNNSPYSVYVTATEDGIPHKFVTISFVWNVEEFKQLLTFLPVVKS